MCIIVAKPTGVNIPDTETLEQCFTSNRDGIGFSYCLPGDKPTISKGFVNVAKLEKMMDAANITKEHNLIIHFRFATHGKKDQGNCHPFPLTANYEQMRWLDCLCEVAIAHNGVFSNMPVSEKHSDTMKFIGGILASPEVIENIDSDSVRELIKGYCGYSSKLAFLKSTGLTLIGNFEEDNGIFYSNSQYKKYTYPSSVDRNKNGQYWCYAHKRYDDCEWCNEHKEYDLCDYNKRITNVKEWKNRHGNLHDKKPLLLNKDKHSCKAQYDVKCLLCSTTEEVKWNNDEQDFLCKACEMIMETQNGVGY